jgi:hypothetical protein
MASAGVRDVEGMPAGSHTCSAMYRWYGVPDPRSATSPASMKFGFE